MSMDTDPSVAPEDGKAQSAKPGTAKPSIEVPDFNPRDWPMAWLIRVEREHMLNATAVLAKNDLAHREFRLLVELARSEGSGVADMAYLTSSERSTTSRTVERMIRKGLVARRPSTTDQRRSSLYLTEAGRRKIVESVPLILNLFDQYAEDLPHEDIAALVTTLQRLNDIVKRVGEKVRDISPARRDLKLTSDD